MISSNVGAFTAIDKKTKNIADICFRKANYKIVAEIPVLRSYGLASLSPKKAFMRLINDLHDQAALIFFDKKAPVNITETERITWEYNNYPRLLATLKAGKPLPEDMEKIYEEMVADLTKFYEEQKAPQHTVGYYTQKQIDEIKNLMNICKDFILEEEFYTEFIMHNLTQDRIFIKGMPFHIANNSPISIVKTIPYFLANAYLEAKKQNKLEGFFRGFTNKYYPCFQDPISNAQEYYYRNLCSDVTKKLTLTLPIVSIKETKQKNFENMLTFFLDRQALRYAAEKKIDTEKTPISQIKAKMIDDGFHLDNNTRANFLTFLQEEGKIVNQMTSDGIITQENIELMAGFAVKVALLS